jgi:methionyl aminopeptidase
MIDRKTPDEIDRMRDLGLLIARTLRTVSAEIVPNRTTTADLDLRVQELFAAANAYPAFKGYRGYPAATCISVNDQVVHGIPSDRVLNEGDIVGIDIGAVRDGYYADAAWSYPVGEVSAEAKRLLNVTREALFQGLAQAKAGNCVGDISSAVQRYVEGQGYSVVRELVGHGIGRAMHEEPSVPNFGRPKSGPRLEAGMTICVEPMVNAGSKEVETLSDNWTVVTKDGALSAHFEHMIAVTPTGPDILTVE